ncbi:MAG TPA: hypothetical protein VK133_02975 [Amoebophilaceae bacterium]|nr:hypothetical protein [Amoebophilaceae bacterium]
MYIAVLKNYEFAAMSPQAEGEPYIHSNSVEWQSVYVNINVGESNRQLTFSQYLVDLVIQPGAQAGTAVQEYLINKTQTIKYDLKFVFVEKLWQCM